jgi:phosphoglycolate phosphatase
MTRKPLTHVVFDLDGTLISSMETVYKLIGQIFGEYFNREVKRDEIDEFYAVSFENMLINKGIDLKHLDWFVKRWSDLNTKTKIEYSLFPNIKVLLKKLKQDGHLLYIWTARDKKSTIEVTKRLKVKDYFTGITCFEDSRSKPDTQGIENLLGTANPKHSIVIGDSHTDILGANKYGSFSIACTWCNSVNLDLLKVSKPNEIVSEPSVCYEIITNYFENLD